MHDGRIRRWRLGRLASSCLIAVALSALAVAGTGAPGALAQSAASMPRLDHVLLIMEENNGYHDVIGDPAAPNLNYLASTFGLETGHFGVSPDSSEPNYVGLLGGIAVVGSTVWAVGTYVDPATDNNNTLILSGQAGVFAMDAGPNPRIGQQHPRRLTAVDGQMWAAGVYDNGGSEIPLVEHR